MIVATVLADRPVELVHRADWPDPARCPRGGRYKVRSYGDLGRLGADWAVGRCVLDAGHGGDCAPEGSQTARRAGRDWPTPATLCGVPMRHDEPWVVIYERPGDRTCRPCATAEGGR